jgi:hypothetical protein
MKLNKTWKIVIGIVTAWVAIYPFAMVAVMFAFLFPTMLTLESDPSEAFPAAFMGGFMIFWFLMMCSSFLQMGTSMFYLIHIIKNRTGSDLLRILSGIGAFFMPYIALPFYFFVFIWPEETPDWALEKTNVPTAAA